MSDPRITTHPASPVQQIGSRSWLYILLAAIAALALWGWNNDWDADEPAAKHSQRQSPTPPVANLVSLFTSDDYPISSLRREEQGTVSFRIDINRSGRVRRCTITKSSGFARLDQATCNIVKRRTRAKPARDAFGDATTGTMTGRVRWVVPSD